MTINQKNKLKHTAEARATAVAHDGCLRDQTLDASADRQIGVRKGLFFFVDLSLSPPLHIYHPLTSPSIPTWELKEPKEESSLFKSFPSQRKDQKKIYYDRGRWFLNAFSAILQTFVFSSQGQRVSIILGKFFGINSNVGGACGGIVALKGKSGQDFNRLVVAQNFE